MRPVTGPSSVATNTYVWNPKRRGLAAAGGLAALLAFSACQAPFGLGLPSTRALENGAVDTLTAATSFEMAGSYAGFGGEWSIDLQLVRPNTEHVVVTKTGVKVEAIIFSNPAQVDGTQGYFRGNQFLSQHMGSDQASRNLVKAAGNAWWKGSVDQVPALPDFTAGITFRSTFLGTAVSHRTDHVTVDGIDAVNLSGPRADVFVAASSPHRLLRVVLKKGAAVDGINDADFAYSNFNQDFKIVPPTNVIDFSNLSTLPPIYTVVSVDTSRCSSPCVVSASIKNLGGKVGAQAPSTITFTVTDSATKQTVGSCQAKVIPDVGYNASKTVTCTITAVSGQQVQAATVTATPENPGRG
jgi:hypothetical protein